MSNYEMKTIKVKGRDYYEVKERVKKFRADFPEHSISTLEPCPPKAPAGLVSPAPDFVHPNLRFISTLAPE